MAIEKNNTFKLVAQKGHKMNIVNIFHEQNQKRQKVNIIIHDAQSLQRNGVLSHAVTPRRVHELAHLLNTRMSRQTSCVALQISTPVMCKLVPWRKISIPSACVCARGPNLSRIPRKPAGWPVNSLEKK